jgi:hypothetical protein
VAAAGRLTAKQTLERFYFPLKSRSFGLRLVQRGRTRAFHPYKADFAWRPSGGATVWLLLGFQSPRLAALPALPLQKETLLARAKVTKFTLL